MSGRYDAGYVLNKESPVNEAHVAAKMAAEALAEKKGSDITLLDVGDLLQITEVFVIATGTSNTHARTLADSVDENLELVGRRVLRDEGRKEGEWILLDYGDFVVHIFQAVPREFYGLERLWGDAERLAWEPASA
jgi:ribosome-associated protein